MTGKKEKMFLECVEENYSRCLGYVLPAVASNEAAAKKLVSDSMKHLWNDYACGKVAKCDVASIVAALDAEISKRSNVYKRGESIFHYDESDLQMLPPKRKMIFIMSRKDGLSSMEIATRMGIAKRTVDKHLELAVKQLKHEL